MGKRIGIPATIIAFLASTILAIFEVMEWKMPELLAKALVTLTVTAIIVVLAVMLHGIWVWVSPILRRYSFRISVDRRDKPNPLQWLIDIAEKQKDNPVTHLVVRDRIYFDFNRDVLRPYVWVRIFYNNLGVHDLLICQPEGFAYYGNEKLPDKIELEEGQSGVSANGGNGEFDFKIYIPIGFVGQVSKETDSETGEIRNLRLWNISAKVYVNSDKTRSVKWSLGGDRVIFRPNR